MTTKLKFLKDAAARTIAWPCKISVPQDGGRFEEQEVTARFRIVPQEKLAELMKSSMASLGQSPDILLLKECLAGFVDVQDETGAAVSDDVATPVFLSLPYVVFGLSRGYYEMVQGRLAKN